MKSFVIRLAKGGPVRSEWRWPTIVTAILIAGCLQRSPNLLVAQSPVSPRATARPGSASPNDTASGKRVPEALATRFLPNAYRIHPKVISGGQPGGDAAFGELVELGVKTIISVDGAQPDVAGAAKHGLRYVHLPHGYDGIPAWRARELAKAVRDLPGAIYIHCHHGKHRSPAAAAVACVSAGLLDSSQAVAILQTAGTSDAYRGLYASARDAQRLDDRLLNALEASFPEAVRVPPVAEAMVAVERAYDHLNSLAAAGWTVLPAHPDLVPAHEALMLREHYRELRRSNAVTTRPEVFRELLRQGETAAQELEQILTSGKGNRNRRAQSALERVARNCTTCHEQFRDFPLSEKRQ